MKVKQKVIQLRHRQILDAHIVPKIRPPVITHKSLHAKGILFRKCMPAVQLPFNKYRSIIIPKALKISTKKMLAVLCQTNAWHKTCAIFKSRFFVFHKFHFSVSSLFNHNNFFRLRTFCRSRSRNLHRRRNRSKSFNNRFSKFCRLLRKDRRIKTKLF